MFDKVIAYKVYDMLFGVRIEDIRKKSSTPFQNVVGLDALSQITGNERTLLVCDLVTVKTELAD